MSLIYVSPGRSVGNGGSGDRLLNFWYRLEWELLVSYGLVPVIDTGIAVVVWQRGSVVRRTGSRREVGTVGDEKVVPKVAWVKRGCGCCSWNPGIPKTVAGVTPGSEGCAVVAQLESDCVLSDIILGRRG